jgi:hypothetical protein
MTQTKNRKRSGGRNAPFESTIYNYTWKFEKKKKGSLLDESGGDNTGCACQVGEVLHTVGLCPMDTVTLIPLVDEPQRNGSFGHADMQLSTNHWSHNIFAYFLAVCWTAGRCYFQRDGVTTIRLIQSFFEDRVISKDLSPRRSPDLIPPNFLWV